MLLSLHAPSNVFPSPLYVPVENAESIQFNYIQSNQSCAASQKTEAKCRLKADACIIMINLK